ncbi:MAG TPA: biotin/lipoyl-binding protein [Burkholderiaceae bacterium]|nr:biotin/lipoyl-binding protein [Burkholderiaceae bacterium]
MSIRVSGTKLIFVLAGLGALGGLMSAIISSQREPAQPPAFQPASNPYADGIFANGIIESDQPHGSNVNIYPEVSGTVTEVPVHAGQLVKRGDALVQIDERVQRATTEQLEAQAQAAKAMLEELRAQPRPENLVVVEAQLAAAEATAKQMRDTYEKQQHAYDIDPHAVSRDALDTARNAWLVADANRVTAQRNLELTRAGAWIYDIRNQEATYASLVKSALSARTLLSKYTLRAPVDGTVLAINVAKGNYISPQGVYNTYTQATNDPVIVFGTAPKTLNVRVYVDEILIPRLSITKDLKGQMFVRGTRESVPIEFVRVEPYVTPKISLSDERLERVDLRVLPVIFRFTVSQGQPVYPGQLVDVYIGK